MLWFLISLHLCCLTAHFIGRHYSAQEAANIGLLDRIFPPSADLIKCAVEFAQTIFNKNMQNRRVSLMKVKDAAQVEFVACCLKCSEFYINFRKL